MSFASSIALSAVLAVPTNFGNFGGIGVDPSTFDRSDLPDAQQREIRDSYSKLRKDKVCTLEHGISVIKPLIS